MRPLRVLAAGVGGMGLVHIRALQSLPEFELVGLVTRGRSALPEGLESLPHVTDFAQALAELTPDAVVISTLTDSHADYAIAAMQAGADVFVEKPLALTIAEAERVLSVAAALGRVLLVGHILEHHPFWQRFIAEARALGGPYVFRIGLNQPSDGALWQTHQRLMQTTSPLVDCGVHYIGVMLAISDAPVTEVHGLGLRLSEDVPAEMYTFGQVQLRFADGSVGWHEAGWGPMVSKTDAFTRDVVAAKGAVSMRAAAGRSTEIVLHSSQLDEAGLYAAPDQVIEADASFDHAALCAAQMSFFARAVCERLDLSAHQCRALQAMRICLAADESIRSGQKLVLAGQGER